MSDNVNTLKGELSAGNPFRVDRYDEQMVRLCADKVMGWHLDVAANAHAEHCWRNAEERYVCNGNWDPLTNDSDNCAVLDKMADDGFVVNITTMVEGVRGWLVQFLGPSGPARSDVVSYGLIRCTGNDITVGDRRRKAIVLAALKAIGVEISA